MTHSLTCTAKIFAKKENTLLKAIVDGMQFAFMELPAFCDLVAHRVHRYIAEAEYQPPEHDEGTGQFSYAGTSAVISRSSLHFWRCEFGLREGTAPRGRESGYRFDMSDAYRLAVVIIDVFDPTVMAAIRATHSASGRVKRSK